MVLQITADLPVVFQRFSDIQPILFATANNVSFRFSQCFPFSNVLNLVHFTFHTTSIIF